MIPLVESLSRRWFDFEVLQFTCYQFMPGWKQGIFCVVWFGFFCYFWTTKSCIKKKKAKDFYKHMCHRQVGDQEGVINPSHGCPIFALTQHMWCCPCSVNLWTQSWLQGSPAPGGSCSPPALARGKAETWQALPGPSLQTKSPCFP